MDWVIFIPADRLFILWLNCRLWKNFNNSLYMHSIQKKCTLLDANNIFSEKMNSIEKINIMKKSLMALYSYNNMTNHKTI